MKSTILRCILVLAAGVSMVASTAAENPFVLETSFARLQIWAEDGHYQIGDLRGGVTWESNPAQKRFGEVTLNVEGKQQRMNLGACEIKRNAEGLEMIFHPLADKPNTLRVTISPLLDKQGLEFRYEADSALSVESIRLLDDALWMTDAEQAYAVVPVREGLLVPADSGKFFTHRFDTFAYEGCHMEMLGLVKNGAAVLLTWHDPYVAAELKSTNGVLGTARVSAKQLLAPALVLRKSAKSFRLQFLGKGDHVSIGMAYRPVAKEKGWLVTWEEKLKGHPERAKLFGTINYKLWSTLSRSMNEESTKEQSARVNWTFDEAAQIAEHLKNDLKLDKVFFLMGGWIRRGYDNQHPDILPSAPECGGDQAFADCAQRVRRLGYLLGLHDNYQDMYRDAPSWDESYLMKNRDGSPTKGGKWAGGRAYLTCAQKAVELAKRPQNLPAVQKLTQADAYFIDTTYAAGLMECFDPKHPLTRWDDMKWKQAISDYGREVFGIFGSECGREWAIPHSDFFEGLTGVSGTYYHDAGLPGKLGATVVPLFEMVYRDCIAMYGKYGYDPAQAAEYVLHHISIGRTLNYHSIPSHLYWKDPTAGENILPLTPAIAEFKQTGARQFEVKYRWTVGKTPERDWRVLVHFTDAAGAIKFQGDYEPSPATSQWQPGELLHGPFTVNVPQNLTGEFDIRIGLFRSPTGPRARLNGPNDSERRCLAGRVLVGGDEIAFNPKAVAPPPASNEAAVFTRADNGWAEGLCLTDRFVKNTYEILSPLNELTSQMLLAQHQFLTPDKKVQRTVFSRGPSTMEVVVNMGRTEYRHGSQSGGEVILPAYGFLVEGPDFVAFHASSWNGVSYDKPALFTLRSLDGKPLSQSQRVRIYHGFGDTRVKVAGKIETVTKEKVIR